MFGTELTLPVVVKGGRKVVTRIVGVDGPRWMLRGIFSGKAATDPDRRNQGAEPAFLQHRRGTRRGPAGPA